MRPRDEPTWSLPEGLSGVVSGSDCGLLMSGDHTLSPDQDTTWVRGGGGARLSTLLNKLAGCLPFS